MNSFKNTILPTYAPLTWLYLAGLVYLICVFISIFLITHQPYLGVSLIADKDGSAVTISAIHTKAAQKQLSVGDTIISIASEGSSLSIGGYFLTPK